jgi:hypothetical protein
MTSRDDLIHDCLHDPSDTAPRLMLADLLEEEGVLTAEVSHLLRDGRGSWLVDNSSRVLWAFPAMAMVNHGLSDKQLMNFVYAHPAQMVCLIVGQIPKGAEVACYSCGRDKDVHWGTYGIGLNWGVSPNRHRWRCRVCDAESA